MGLCRSYQIASAGCSNAELAVREVSNYTLHKRKATLHTGEPVSRAIEFTGIVGLNGL